MVLDVKRIYRNIMEDPDIVADNDTSKEEIAMDLATQRVVQHERNIQANNLGSTVSKLLQFLEKADDDDEDERYQDLTHHVDDAHAKISNYKNRNVKTNLKDELINAITEKLFFNRYEEITPSISFGGQFGKENNWGWGGQLQLNKKGQPGSVGFNIGRSF